MRKGLPSGQERLQSGQKEHQVDLKLRKKAPRNAKNGPVGLKSELDLAHLVPFLATV